MDYETLGENIRKYRTMRKPKMTQAQLAEKVGCSDSHIGQIENARGIPSLETVVAIANTLDVSVDQLLKKDLRNQTNYFIQEILHLSEHLAPNDRVFALEVFRSLLKTMNDFKP